MVDSSERAREIAKAYAKDEGKTDCTLIECPTCGTNIDLEYYEYCGVCEALPPTLSNSCLECFGDGVVSDTETGIEHTCCECYGRGIVSLKELYVRPITE